MNCRRNDHFSKSKFSQSNALMIGAFLLIPMAQAIADTASGGKSSQGEPVNEVIYQEVVDVSRLKEQLRSGNSIPGRIEACLVSHFRSHVKTQKSLRKISSGGAYKIRFYRLETPEGGFSSEATTANGNHEVGGDVIQWKVNSAMLKAPENPKCSQIPVVSEVIKFWNEKLGLSGGAEDKDAFKTADKVIKESQMKRNETAENLDTPEATTLAAATRGDKLGSNASATSSVSDDPGVNIEPVDQFGQSDAPQRGTSAGGLSDPNSAEALEPAAVIYK